MASPDRRGCARPVNVLSETRRCSSDHPQTSGACARAGEDDRDDEAAPRCPRPPSPARTRESSPAVVQALDRELRHVARPSRRPVTLGRLERRPGGFDDVGAERLIAVVHEGQAAGDALERRLRRSPASRVPCRLRAATPIDASSHSWVTRSISRAASKRPASKRARRRRPTARRGAHRRTRRRDCVERRSSTLAALFTTSRLGPGQRFRIVDVRLRRHEPSSPSGLEVGPVVEERQRGRLESRPMPASPGVDGTKSSSIGLRGRAAPRLRSC